MSERSQNIDDRLAMVELKQLLVKILNAKSRAKYVLVRKFEDLINEYWSKKENIFNDDINGLFGDLLTDMALYQPNFFIRFLSSGLIDDNKLNQLIRETLEKLEQYG